MLNLSGARPAHYRDELPRDNDDDDTSIRPGRRGLIQPIRAEAGTEQVMDFTLHSVIDDTMRTLDSHNYRLLPPPPCCWQQKMSATCAALPASIFLRRPSRRLFYLYRTLRYLIKLY